ncbi:unnamed protein product [Linum tenue]|uniref:Uncharacterized protein n=1 Tax=Linum tenue TaxID=586396 RepID=A0AAV0KS02_9ROSI|nr:unnamed protein product [Linum tenue]
MVEDSAVVNMEELDNDADLDNMAKTDNDNDDLNEEHIKKDDVFVPVNDEQLKDDVNVPKNLTDDNNLGVVTIVPTYSLTWKHLWFHNQDDEPASRGKKLKQRKDATRIKKRLKSTGEHASE